MLLCGFDLDMRFGPCMGPTRLQRWRRAEWLRLGPPAEVLAVLQRLPVGDPERLHLWRGHSL